MFKNPIAPLALASLLVVSLPVFSQETAVQPGQDEAPAIAPPAAEAQAPEAAAPAETAAPAEAAPPAEAGGAVTMPGMMGRSMMGPGVKRCHTGMRGMKGMMSGPMGKGGMKGMAPAGMGRHGMKGCYAHGAGISKKQYRELMGRLDVLDARMAKIDAMLERLLQR